jgi:hypothetical protein
MLSPRSFTRRPPPGEGLALSLAVLICNCWLIDGTPFNWLQGAVHDEHSPGK